MRCIQFVFSLSLLTASFSIFAGQYDVTLLSKQGKISVKGCLTNLNERLIVGNKRAGRYVITNNDSNLIHSHSSLRIKNSSNLCFSYIVDLHKARKDRLAYQLGKSWLVNNHSWLWLPKKPEPVYAQFKDDKGNPELISAPWRQKEGKFHVNQTPIHWTSRIAFGHVDIKPTAVRESILNVAILDIEQAAKRAELARWVGTAGEAVANIYGHFPLTDVQVIIVPIGKRKEAVPWAEVQRNGHPAVHFFIDQHRPIEEFYADWTATHELSHLLHPRIQYQDRWLSEGLASYYQFIAQARADMISKEQAWKKLTAGLERGRIKADRPLRSAKQTRHAYWGGAAIYFLADIALRESSSNQTLNYVLKQFAIKHLPSDTLWSAEEYMQSLDDISQTEIFTSLLNEQAVGPNFPISRADESKLSPSINKHTSAILGGN